MALNPEQIPKSSEIDVPHGGEPVSPDATRIQPGIKAPDTVYEGFESLPPTIPERQDWEQKRTDVRNNSLPAPEKKKLSLGVKLGAAAAALAAAAGIAWGISANATDDGKVGTSPDTQPTATAPVTPGAGETPAPTAPAETEQPVDANNFKFSVGENGETQTFEDVQKSVAFSVDVIKNPPEVLRQTVTRMNDVANWLPTEKDVRESLNKPTEQLSVDDYMLVYDEYLRAHDAMFSVKSGDLYDTLQKFCKQTAYNHILTVANGETVPYEGKVELHTKDTGIRFTDNSLENSIDDNAHDYLGNYRLLSSGMNDVTSNNGYWYLSGQMELIRNDEAPAK